MIEILEAIWRREVTDWLDSDGRPLGERSSVHWSSTGPVEKPCPYHDARLEANLPINVAALRQVSAHLERMLEIVRGLVARRVAPGQTPTAHDVWCANHEANAASIFLGLRGNPVRPIPAAISALYKASLGFSQVFPMILMEREDAASTAMEDLYDAESFFATLEARRWLIGQHQVCAGTREQILLFYEAFLGRPRPGVAARLPDALRDPTFARFAERYRTLEALSITYVAAVALFVNRGQLSGVEDYGALPQDQDRGRWPVGLRLHALRDLSFVAIARLPPQKSPVQVAWLYPDGEFPQALIDLLVGIDPDGEAPLWQLDAIFVESASPVLASMADALGLEASADALTLEALRGLVAREEARHSELT